jgi:hypothetical protein
MKRVVSHRRVIRCLVIGQKWYMDYSGPFIESINGNLRYLVIFIEDVTGYIAVFFTLTRDAPEAIRTLKEFENKFLLRIRANGVRNILIQSDNGEFKSMLVKQHCREAGILQRYTAPYSSSSNGRAERAIGVVKATGRVLLGHSGLEETFWTFAAKTAAYLINASPSKIDGKWEREPRFKYLGQTVPFDRLRAFGARATLLDKDRLKNWKPTGVTGIMVGYTEDSPAYDIWIPKTEQLVHSAHVRFDETIPTTLHGGIARSKVTAEQPIGAYECLVGKIHVDPDDMTVYRVTGIRLENGIVMADREIYPGPGESSPTIRAQDLLSLPEPNDTVIAADELTEQCLEVTSHQPVNPKKRPKKAGQSLERHQPGILKRPVEIGDQPTVVTAETRNPRRTKTRFETPVAEVAPLDDMVNRISATRSETPVAEVAPPDDMVNREVPPRSEDPDLTGKGSTKRIIPKRKTYPREPYGTRSTGRGVAGLNNNLTLFEVHSITDIFTEDYYVVPKTHNQALQLVAREYWLAAEESELTSLQLSGCLVVDDLPKGRKPLNIKWVYALKTDSHNVIQRFKARAVARGDQAKEGIDYNETFSSVVRWESIRIYLALTVLLGLIPLQLDVDTAYLYADLEEVIYANPPDGVELPPGKCYRVKKSLYGLPQSGRNWNILLDSVLSGWEFVRLDEDRCLYFRSVDGIITLLFIYVDDLYISSKSKTHLKLFTDYLSSHFKIKLLGVPRDLLGITLTWGEEFGSVQLNCTKLINKLIGKFWTDSDVEKDIPMNPRLRLEKEDQMQETPNYRLTKDDKAMQKSFRTLTGTFIFLVNTCRVDISFASMILCRSMAHPGWKHFDAAKWLLGYLKKHPDLGVIYFKEGNNRPYGYCDADHGSDWSRRSIAGYMFFLAGGPICWKASLLGDVCLATAESETRAIDAAKGPIKECCWLIKVLEELGHPMLGPQPFDRIQLRTTQDFSNMEPMVIFEDNEATIRYAKNPTGHTLMKHLDRHLKWIRQQVERKKILLIHVETKLQLADIFTKALDVQLFWDMTGRFMSTLDEFSSFFST